MYICTYVAVLGDDGTMKMTSYHVTWLPSGNKTFTSYLHISVTDLLDAYWTQDMPKTEVNSMSGNNIVKYDFALKLLFGTKY